MSNKDNAIPGEFLQDDNAIMRINATAIITDETPIDQNVARYKALVKIRDMLPALTFILKTKIFLDNITVFKGEGTSGKSYQENHRLIPLKNFDKSLNNGISQLIQRYQYDEDVMEVLQLLYFMESPYELMVLYKVFEIIKDDFKNPVLATLYKQGNFYEDLKNFKGCANPKSASNILSARHGHDQRGKGKNVMKPEDAIKWGLNQVNDWITFKLLQKGSNP